MQARKNGGDALAAAAQAHSAFGILHLRNRCQRAVCREENVAATALRLSFAVADYPHTAALKSGAVRFEGIEPQFADVKPQIAAFRRMVREVEFDVCEWAPTPYVIARAYGAPFVALPVFVMRRFHHSGLLVRPDAGITRPKD